jgi:hypothetical protein
MGPHTFVLVWWEARYWRWARFTVADPLHGVAVRVESGHLGARARSASADELRARAAERLAGAGVTPECVAVLGIGEVPRG